MAESVINTLVNDALDTADAAIDRIDEIVDVVDVAKSSHRGRKILLTLLTLAGLAVIAYVIVKRTSGSDDDSMVAPDPFGAAVEAERRADVFAVPGS
jgi:hypothetical protein